MKGDNSMIDKNFTKKFVFMFFVVLAFGCAGADAQPEQAVIETAKAAEEVQAESEPKNPIVVYYSRTGNARMLANSLAAQTGAEIEEMQSEDRGIFTILGEQWFWGDDEQKPLEKNLQDYSPIIVVAPIYLMQLSAPGRLFIEEFIPEGSDVYVFTTSGGPLADFTQEGIAELVTESGLNAKGVYGFQAGKTQEEFDKEVSAFLKEHQLVGLSPDAAQPLQEKTNSDTEE
jgi:flavodoxin